MTIEEVKKEIASICEKAKVQDEDIEIVLANRKIKQAEINEK